LTSVTGYTARDGQTTGITCEKATGTRRRYWPQRVQSGPVDVTYAYDAAADSSALDPIPWTLSERHRCPP